MKDDIQSKGAVSTRGQSHTTLKRLMERLQWLQREEERTKQLIRIEIKSINGKL